MREMQHVSSNHSPPPTTTPSHAMGDATRKDAFWRAVASQDTR